ncbi:MAG: hypothetical protein H0U53_03505 [Actinobacteria bacterium]|nr:hypothetical protein [Actinomycetota bacterium]
MKRKTLRDRFALVTSVALVGGALFGPTPVSAQTAGSAMGSAYGVQLGGPVPIAARPTVEAVVPPGTEVHETDSLIEVPADPLATSFTALVEADASTKPDIEAKLQDTIEGQFAGAPAKWHGRGFAITEDLVAVTGQVTADVIESESVAGCDGTTPVFGSATRILNLSLGGTNIPIINPSPNQTLVDAGGIKIVFWETNWDPATGGTTDGEDTVFTNALHVTAPAGVDLIVSHSDATVATCRPAQPEPDPDPEPEPPAPPAPPAAPIEDEPLFTG